MKFTWHDVRCERIFHYLEIVLSILIKMEEMQFEADEALSRGRARAWHMGKSANDGLDLRA